MMNQSWCRPLGGGCAPESVRRQGLRHAITHCISNDFAGEDVLHAGQVKPSLAGLDIRDISHPRFVWPSRRECLIQQIICHGKIVIRVRRRLEFALLRAAQSQFSAQSHNAVTASLEALCRKFGLHTQRPVGL